MVVIVAAGIGATAAASYAALRKIRSAVDGAKSPSVLLFDGKCAVCNFTVCFVLARNSRNTLRYASLHSPAGKKMAEEAGVNVWEGGAKYKDGTESPNTSVLIENGTAHVRLNAAAAVLPHLDGAWPLLVMPLYVVPGFLRDVFYNWFAANRFRFFGEGDPGKCTELARSADKRDLFLDK
mmetsp:Transcript_88759/g.237479  ORF Transcript_88759/g.237479 Transcript_88759/m.237479 type:complete len:180 (+) Transcript_88759:53-592(+)